MTGRLRVLGYVARRLFFSRDDDPVRVIWDLDASQLVRHSDRTPVSAGERRHSEFLDRYYGESPLDDARMAILARENQCDTYRLVGGPEKGTYFIGNGPNP